MLSIPGVCAKDHPQNAPISLILTGPEGTQEFLRAEFSEAFL